MAADLERRGVVYDLDKIQEQMRLYLAADGLARKRWAVLLRGAAGIVFGHVTIVAPVTSFAALAPVFGVYALVDGVLAMTGAHWRSGGRSALWAFVLAGIAGMGTGCAVLLRPGVVGQFSLVELIAAWALATGLLEVFAALRLRKVVGGASLLGLSGAFSLAFGALLVLFPHAAELAIVLGISAYAFVCGVLLIALGLRLRSRRPHAPPCSVRPAQAWADV